MIENPKLKTPNMKLLTCDSDNEKPILVKSLFPKGVAIIETYGSCNGVFCLKGIYPGETHPDQLIAWNPTTNEVHVIPRAPSLGNHYINNFFYGFGAVNGDFKVVKFNLSNYNETTKMLYLVSAEVYHVSTKSWTPIPNSPPPWTVITNREPSRYNTLVNGVYHWITSSYFISEIICFDFHNNQFQQLEAPNLRDATPFIPYFCDDVIEIKGSLGYVVEYRFFSMVWLEIWLMEQNGWAKQFNIDTNRTMFSIYGIYGGKVEQQQLTSYDHQGNALRQFQIDIFEKGSFENDSFWF